MRPFRDKFHRILLERMAWIVLAVVGAVLFLWSYPRALPMMPESLSLTRDEAIEKGRTAIESFTEVDEEAYVSARLEPDEAFERRLIGDLGRHQLEELRRHRLGRHVASWSVRITEVDGATHRARVSLYGEVMSVRVYLGDRERVLGEEEAKRRAREELSHYMDLSADDSPFVFRSQSRPGSLEVRFPILDLPAPLDGLSHGLAVYFEGREIAGWGSWLVDSRASLGRLDVDSWKVLRTLRQALVGLLFLILATAFYRYYDAGELRFRRSLQLALLVAGAGLVWMVHYLEVQPENLPFGGPLSLIIAVLVVAFMAFLTFVTVGVGDALARHRWGHRLAAFEALCQGDLRNATVARASFHGLAGGVFLAGMSVALVLPMGWYGAGPLAGKVLDRAFVGGQPGIAALFTDVFLRLVPHLLLLLVLVPVLLRRLGSRWGAVVALFAAAVMITPPLRPVPLFHAFPWLLLVSAVPLFLFFYSDLWASVLAAVFARMIVLCHPLLLAEDAWLQLGGAATLALVALPPVYTLFWLGSERSFNYRFDPIAEVPEEVLERIRERERQRLELETGRQIQRAILPPLPASLHGVEIAHAFTPATEIGGDFYHVIPLDDGRRIALALGDVAGHGVASGLVMSAVRGALEVHLRFEPGVEEVFASLNRLLCEGGGLRLLTTLAYGILDPQEHRLTFAGAGQIVWVVRDTVSSGAAPEKTVEELLPEVYPLGVRRESRVEVKYVDLQPGDAVFLASDGVVEAQGNDQEPFGYERLEASLGRFAGRSATEILDGVRQDLDAFVGERPAEDDRTLLVLRMPDEPVAKTPRRGEIT